MEACNWGVESIGSRGEWRREQGVRTQRAVGGYASIQSGVRRVRLATVEPEPPRHLQECNGART